MSFDEKCYELAEHFLPSMASERLKAALAQTVQDAVEDYMVGEAVNLQSIADPKPIPRCLRCDNNHWPHCPSQKPEAYNKALTGQRREPSR